MLDVYHRVQPPPITLACGVTGGAIASPELFKKIRESFNFNNIKVKVKERKKNPFRLILVFFLIEIIKVFRVCSLRGKKKKKLAIFGNF